MFSFKCSFSFRQIGAKGVFLLLLLGVFALSGCKMATVMGTLSPSPDLDPRAEAMAKRFATVPGKAVVYVYRNKYTDLTAIYFNDEHVATLNHEFFARVVLPEGTYEVRADAMDKSGKAGITGLGVATESFDLRADNVYYIQNRTTVVPTGLIVSVYRNRLLLMSPAEAKSEIIRRKLVNDYWME